MIFGMSYADIGAIATAGAAIVTAIGVIVAARHLRLTRQIEQAAFEDSFDQQYRELSFAIPVNALLGGDVTEDEESVAREACYNYLDLSNEQIYQRKLGKISEDRWNEWNSGIESNLKRPFFKDVWKVVKTQAPGTFSYLEDLENYGFDVDPKKFR